MADLFLTNGDISNTLFGDIGVVESYDEITQSAVNNVLTILGENQYHSDIGNMAHRRRLKSSDSNLDLVMKDCIDAILVDTRVDSVASITASYDNDNKNNINIAFTIKTTDGTITSSTIIITI